MHIPVSPRKKALLVIDVQSGFLIERNTYILPNIIKLIREGDYDLIVYSIQYNKPESIWFTQIWWCETVPETETIPEILEALEWKKVVKVNKLTRSIWKCDGGLDEILKTEGINEVHLCGYESNDCVLASTLEASDLWYFAFVIEEATETRTTQANHPHAIAILNYLKLTNNSQYVEKKTREIM